jgi:hypothetical protein
LAQDSGAGGPLAFDGIDLFNRVRRNLNAQPVV